MSKMKCHVMGVAIGIAAVWILGFVSSGASGNPVKAIERSQSAASVGHNTADEFLIEAPGIRVRKVYAAAEVRIPGDHFVTGVVINGQARAYLETGMAQPESHIAYDRIGGRDLAVAYCDKTGDSRVFCGDRKTIESIRVGGWRNENMELLIGKDRFALDSAAIPLEEVEFKTLPWMEWKAMHPDTDLYLGDLVPGQSLWLWDWHNIAD